VAASPCLAGTRAWVQVLFPVSKGGTICVECVGVEGGLLEQLFGPSVFDFYLAKCTKDFEEENPQQVKAKTDNHGCIKMSFQGPDVCFFPPHTAPPPDIKSNLSVNPYVVRRVVKPESARNVQQGTVPVVYVYRKDASAYTNVSTCKEETGDGILVRSCYSVPVGKPIASGSNRYVYHMCI